MKLVRTTVSLDEQMLEEAKAEAAITHDTTRSDVLRRWMRKGKEIEGLKAKPCTYCHGRGFYSSNQSNSFLYCPRCKGTGEEP